MAGFLDNYEDVATRIKRFWETHPNGRIETNILDFNAEKGFVLIQCKVWRDMKEPFAAGTDMAFGNVQTYNVGMKKWFVEDTATSAIGRAIGLVLGSDTRPTLQNMEQVEKVDSQIVKASEEDKDYWTTNFDPEAEGIPTFKSAVETIKTGLGGTLVPASPRCAHGSMVWKEGQKAGGKAWGGYFCTERLKANQCPPDWHVLGSDGQWGRQ